MLQLASKNQVFIENRGESLNDEPNFYTWSEYLSISGLKYSIFYLGVGLWKGMTFP